MDFVRDSGCYHSEVAPFGFAYDLQFYCETDMLTGFVALEGSGIGVLPQLGSTHRICELVLQPHCGQDL
jgi:hypothetical protein